MAYSAECVALLQSKLGRTSGSDIGRGMGAGCGAGMGGGCGAGVGGGCGAGVGGGCGAGMGGGGEISADRRAAHSRSAASRASAISPECLPFRVPLVSPAPQAAAKRRCQSCTDLKALYAVSSAHASRAAWIAAEYFAPVRTAP